MVKENYNNPEYLWGRKNYDLEALVEAGYQGITKQTLDFSDSWINTGADVDETLSTSQLSYSSNTNYCLLDVGSSVCYPTNSDKSNWVQG